MRPLLTSLLIVVAAASAAAQRLRSGAPPVGVPSREVIVTPERVDRFAQWVNAVDQHEPGERDASLEDLASWSADDLRALWADAQFLAAVMRNLKMNRFSIQDP